MMKTFFFDFLNGQFGFFKKIPFLKKTFCVFVLFLDFYKEPFCPVYYEAFVTWTAQYRQAFVTWTAQYRQARWTQRNNQILKWKNINLLHALGLHL